MANFSEIPDFTPSTDPEIRQLQEFVLEIKKILEDVVFNPWPAIAGRHHERLRAAWEDAMHGKDTGEDRFSRFMKNLDGNIPNMPNETPETIRQKLEDVGLRGAPLEFKLGLYKHARDDYRDLGTARHEESGQKDLKFKVRKILGRVFQTGGVILGSTASQIPGGEYINELVEGAHIATEITGDMEEQSNPE